MLLSGESGVGKTRLALALAKEARDRRIDVLTAEVEPPAGGPSDERTLTPLLPALSTLAERLDEGAAHGPLARAVAVLGEHVPALSAVAERWGVPRPLTLPAPAARHRLVRSLDQLLETAIGGRPTMLVVDDLQWADDATLALIEHLQRDRSLLPLLVVGTYRAEEASDRLDRLLASPNVHVSIARLGPEAVEAIVSQMLALPAVPASFVELLARHSEGNPFFVCEYLRMAVGEGVLTRRDGAWRFGTRELHEAASLESAFPIPSSVKDVVERRLGGLSPGARAVLAACAVIGREIDPELLVEVAAAPPEVLLDGTAELARRHVLEEAHAHAGRLRFVHDKIREVAYAVIPAGSLRELHRAAAAAIERLMPEGHDAALGRHWEQAGEHERARSRYRVAVPQAVKRGSLREALRLSDACLRLSREANREDVRVRVQKGHLLQRLGQMTEARQELSLALEEAERLSDPGTTAAATMALGRLARATGRMGESEALLARAAALSREQGDKAAEGLACGELGSTLREQGRMEEAGDLFERGLACHREAGDRAEQGTSLANLGILRYEQGRMDEARRFFAEALALQREVGAALNEGTTLGNLALLEFDEGRLDLARSLWERALRIARETGERRAEGAMLGNVALVYMDVGDVVAAEQALRQAIAIDREVGNQAFEALAMSNLGIVCLDDGRLDEAAELLERALTLARDVRQRRFEGMALSHLGRLRLDQRRHGEAWPLLEAALGIHREVGNRRFEGTTLVDMAMLLRLSGGDRQEAARLLAQARSAADAAGDRRTTFQAACEEGFLDLERGGSGAVALAQASRLVEELGLSGHFAVTSKLDALARAVQAAEQSRRV